MHRVPRLMFVVTSHESVNLLIGPLLPDLADGGWDVDVVCSPGPVHPHISEHATVHVIPMTRAISPGRDLASVVALSRCMARVRPDVVVASTPKGGFVGSVAARMSGVPARVLHVWGARWDGSSGYGAIAMRAADRVAASASTDVLAVSASMRDLWRRWGITRKPISVLGAGASKGVDSSVFFPDPNHTLAPDAPELGFAGRLAVDKGVDRVLEAFDHVRRVRPGARLTVVGDPDAAQPIDEATRVRLASDPAVEWIPAVDQRTLAGIMRRWDLLVFPSRREGLPNVVIEAAACGVPVVAFDVTGVRDAVVAGRTGELVPWDEPLGPAALGVLEPARHADLRREASTRAAEVFAAERVLADFTDYLHAVLVRAQARRREGFYLRRGKRWVDLAVAGAALVVLSPVVGCTAVAVRLRLGRPVLFTQERGGLGGGTFRILKFRTLTDSRAADGSLLPDAERLTPLGSRLRALSLDELPGLVNVLRGDMSLVGPRPLVARYLDRYSDEQARRHEVRPGLTGWVQVNGRNSLTWEEKFALDVWYVDHASWRVDLGILLRTVEVVIGREGVSGSGHATMPEFTGSDARELRPPLPPS